MVRRRRLMRRLTAGLLLALALGAHARADEPIAPPAEAAAQDAPAPPAPPPAAPAEPPKDVPKDAPKDAAAPPKNLVPIPKDEAVSVLGKKVTGPAGEDMGRVVDLLLDREGAIKSIVIDFGGFLGVGSRKIAIDWQLVHFRPDNKDAPVELGLGKAEVQAAPEYKDSAQPPVMVGPPPPPAPPPPPPPPPPAPDTPPAPAAPPASDAAPSASEPAPDAPR